MCTHVMRACVCVCVCLRVCVCVCVCVCIYAAERPLQPTEDRTQNTGASTISQKSFCILRSKISDKLIFENSQLTYNRAQNTSAEFLSKVSPIVIQYSQFSGMLIFENCVAVCCSAMSQLTDGCTQSSEYWCINNFAKVTYIFILRW